MTEEEWDDLAYGIVEDYLREGPDLQMVFEAVQDNDGDPSGEDLSEVSDRVRRRLSVLSDWL